jgi:hypothetical protein
MMRSLVAAGISASSVTPIPDARSFHEATGFVSKEKQTKILPGKRFSPHAADGRGWISDDHRLFNG